MAVIAPKPFYHPARYLPRFHWELLACGARGHVLAGTDVREVTERGQRDRARDGRRALAPLPALRRLGAAGASRRAGARPGAAHAEIELPLRGRAMRDLIVLRLIAIDRFIHFIVLAALAGAVLVFANDQAHLRRLYDTALRAIEGVNNGPLPRHHGLLGEIDSCFTPTRTRST